MKNDRNDRDIEKSLREIHRLLAEAPKVDESDEDKVIVSKKAIIQLLEDLNYDLIDMMDDYDTTNFKYEQKVLRARKRGEEAYEEMKRKADDTYAASLIYSNNAMKELNDFVIDAQEDFRRVYESFTNRLGLKAAEFSKRADDCYDRLNVMSQSPKYLDIIEKENEKRRTIANMVDDLAGNEYDELADEDDDYEDDYELAEKETERKKKVSEMIAKEWADEDAGEAEIENIGEAAYEEFAEEIQEEKKSVPAYEVKVNPAYVGMVNATSEELDAEYEEWLRNGGREGEQKEQESPEDTSVDGAASSAKEVEGNIGEVKDASSEEKKGKKLGGLFSKKKKK